MKFYEVINAAIDDLSKYGFGDISRLERWQREIEIAAEKELKSESQLTNRLKDHLSRIYASKIDREFILKDHQISRWTLAKLKPKLKHQLDARIIASAQLIKLNRADMIQNTLRRFSGWATSLPMGGSEAVDKREVAGEIKKALKSENFSTRRVLIDQSHKFKASLDNIIATDGGAIAAEWKIRNTPGYNNRHSHKERDGKIYLIRNSWAQKEGLIKPAGHEYTDEITQPAEEVFCSCAYVYLYNLRDMPNECITEKGRAVLAK